MKHPDAIASPFYYTKSELERNKVEQYVRIKQTQGIMQVAGHLGLPYYSKSTALYLYHRFMAAYDITDRKLEYIYVACLSLAMKIEETVKKMSDIYIAVIFVVHGKAVEPDLKELKELRDVVMDLERLLLEDIQFDVEILSPHRFMLSFCKSVDGMI